MTAGPTLSVGSMIGTTATTAVDFPVRPTINGSAFSIASPYVVPSLTASSPSSTGTVTVVNPQMVTWGTLSNLSFTANTTPTAVGGASFLISLPGRVTNFSNYYDIKAWITGKDASGNIVNNCVGIATVSGVTAQISFTVNGSSPYVMHTLDCRLEYTSI